MMDHHTQKVQEQRKQYFKQQGWRRSFDVPMKNPEFAPENHKTGSRFCLQDTIMDQVKAMCEMSLALDRRFNTSCYSEYARFFSYNTDPLFEILWNTTNNLKHYNKIVGSHAELTNSNLSDVDVLKIFPTSTVGYHPREAIFSNKTYLRLTKGPSTQAGYTKLQIYRNGKPNKSDNMQSLYHDIHFVNINNGKSFLTNKIITPLMINGIPISTVNHGPALNSKSICYGGGIDSVAAYESQTIPNEMMPWFERKRSYNWPTKETFDLFKSMGCCYVGVGHLKSPEKHLEWRISPTRQELYLMLHLNQTQYRCYIILKVIKKDIVEKECGDMLSSYHCKTALFYTIENNNPDIWQPRNLIQCVLKCLKLLQYWVKQRNCPNYFISEENMFETKLLDNNKTEKLQTFLGTFTDNSLETYFNLMHYWNGFTTFYRTSEKSIILNRISYIKMVLLDVSKFSRSSKCKQRQRVKALYDKTNSQTEQTIFEEIKNVLPYEPNLDILVSVLKEKLLHLTRFEQLLSVMRRRMSVDKYLDIHKDITETLPEDFQYYLKLACIAMAQKNHAACDKLLHKVRYIAYRTIFVCGCVFTNLIPDTKIWITSKTCDILDKKMTSAGKCLNRTHEILQQFTTCLKFIDTELDGGMVIVPLHLEAYKTVGKSQHMKVFTEERKSVEDLMSVHPVTYMLFLQYKNSEMIKMKSAMCVALEKLENDNLVSLQEGTYSHPDIILNVLGHIYITKGWYRPALQCFRRSWELYPDINSAKWHIMFLLFGGPKQAGKRRVKKKKKKKKS